MRMKAWAVLGLLISAGASAGPQELDTKSFEKMLKLVKPSPEESSWSDIPWIVDQDKARRKAAAEGKPLVVWNMGGEPLGVG